MRTLILTPVWPEPTSSAAGVRVIQLIMMLKQCGAEVAIGSPAVSNSFRSALEEQGVSTHEFPLNDSTVERTLATLAPEISIFDRFITEEQFGWRVAAQLPECLRILDTVDLHFLRRGRGKLAAQDKNSLINEDPNPSLPISEDCVRELSSIYRSDLSLILSDFELQLLRERFSVSEDLLCYLPLAAQPEVAPPLPFAERQHYVTIGNFNHPPNLDSYRTLINLLWPKIRELSPSGSELHIYGAYSERYQTELARPEIGIRIMGQAKDAVLTLARYRINLAPLRFGAGIKGKILDGWSAGTPVITTSIGAEGMREGEIFGGRIADRIDQFVVKASECYQNEASWQTLAEAGRRLISSKFAPASIEQRFITALESARREQLTRRNANIFGAILQYQKNRSTEYFSRWIEGKNSSKRLP